MAEVTSSRTAREPWPGYADLSEDERQQELARRFDDAKEHGDHSHAYALASAVANYELVHELQPDTTHAEQVAAKAHDLHDDAGSWIGS
ncbi:hypothetical protein [Candidatus Solirubrobacter pratensis]|uniref:hypothetical protein n=1 Tax=Candidatus Solirubrobacter pratensis TaxID=1298857 RepID=UPI00041D2F1A|nr:hypothetical protein [Candidatus Solirubrobacter pratensis]